MRFDDFQFLGACHDTTPNPRQLFCNYLYSEIEYLDEGDFLIFKNETVKLLSGIQHKAEECKRHVTTTQQVTKFQLPEATQPTAGGGYILTIPDIQQVSTTAVQPTQTTAPQQPTVITKVQQPQRSASSKPASFIVVDDQQPGPSRQLMFALSPTKTFNLPSVTSGQQEDSQHNMSGLSSLFGSIPSVLQYQQIDLPASSASRISPNQQMSIY